MKNESLGYKLVQFLKDRGFATKDDNFEEINIFDNDYFKDVRELQIYREYTAFPPKYNMNLLYYEFYIKYSFKGKEHYVTMYNTCHNTPRQYVWNITSITHKDLMTRMNWRV